MLEYFAPFVKRGIPGLKVWLMIRSSTNGCGDLNYIFHLLPLLLDNGIKDVKFDIDLDDCYVGDIQGILTKSIRPYEDGISMINGFSPKQLLKDLILIGNTSTTDVESTRRSFMRLKPMAGWRVHALEMN
jgi:hypothetical protein